MCTSNAGLGTGSECRTRTRPKPVPSHGLNKPTSVPTRAEAESVTAFFTSEFANSWFSYFRPHVHVLILAAWLTKHISDVEKPRATQTHQSVPVHFLQITKTCRRTRFQCQKYNNNCLHTFIIRYPACRRNDYWPKIIKTVRFCGRLILNI